MIFSILLITPTKFNVVAAAKFFTEYGVSQVHSKTFDNVSNDALPETDMLVILYDDTCSLDTLAAIKKNYGDRSIPVLEYAVGSERQMHKDFIKISFGDSLDVLRKPDVRAASKVLFIISRFFRSPKGFETKLLRVKYEHLTGAKLGAPLVSSYCKSFCRQGYLTQKDPHTYCFKALDSEAESKLRRAGFDVFEPDVVTVPAVDKVATPKPTTAPVVPQDTLRFLHEEFAQLRRDFSDQLQVEVSRIFKMQNINSRLLNLKAEDLAKVESYLEFVALSKGNQ